MSRRRNSAAALLCAALCLHAPGALGERADRNKPIHIEADRVTVDDAQQMATFTGDVVMTQGTLLISGQQITATQGSAGLEHGTATGSPAKFRQKRDGADEYVEGSGARIEYNATSGVMDIYGQAHVKRGQDDVRGDHITYNSHDQSFKVSGEQAPVNGKRVTVTIGPRTPASAVPPATESLPIQPETRLIKQDDKQ